MQLMRVSAGGVSPLKSQRFELDLEAGVTLIAGPNGSGKSARLLNITAGLWGLASTATDDAREYLGDDAPQATTALVFDTGAVLARDHSQGPRTQAHKALTTKAEALVGKQPMRWDLADFVRATDSARAAVLTAAVQAAQVQGEWDPEALVATWRREEAFAGLEDTLLDKAVAKAGDMDSADWLERTAKWAAGHAKAANSAKRSAKATLDRLSASEADVPRGTLPKARKRLEAARAAMAELQGAIASEEGWKTQHAAWTAEKKRCTEAAQRIEDEIQRLETQESKALDRLGELGDPLDADEWEQKEAEARAAALKLDAQVEELCARLDRLPQADAEPPEVEGWTWQAEGEWHQGSVTVTLDEDPASVVVDPGEHHLVVYPIPVAIVRHLLDVHNAEQIEAEREQLKADLEKAQAQLTRKQASHARRARRLRRAHAQVEARADRDQARGELAEKKQEREQAAAALSEWSKVEPQRPVVDRTRITAAQAELTQAEANVEAHVRAEEHESNLRQARADLTAQTVRWKQAKALKQLCEQERHRMAGAAFAPICEAANDFLQRVEPTWSVYVHSASDLGICKDGETVNMWALSKSERALLGAALAIALAQLMRRPWKVLLLDDVENMDEGRLPKVLAALVALCESGALDQAILAQATRVLPEPVDGVSVHWLGTGSPA